MEQFSLKKYLKNPDRAVVTEDGRSVKIVSTEGANNEYPVIVLIREENKERVDFYTKDGEYSKHYVCGNNLFFVPIKKEGWINLYQTDNVLPNLGSLYDTKEKALENRLQTPKCISTVKIEWEE